MRLDRLLFCLRLAKSRTAAQRWIGEGHIRLNGARVTRQDQSIAVGDVLTLPFPRKVAVIELLALPARRGPAVEAQACYRPLDAHAPKRIAGRNAPAEGKAQQ
jgi:ribosome-associated heat shock protein Hsp15